MKNPMNIFMLPLIMLMFGLGACSPDEVELYTIPDLSSCSCGAGFDPVCGTDGRNYLSSCHAECAGVSVATDTLCGPDSYVEADSMTWPIRQVCYPIGIPNTTPTTIRSLADGTVLYQDVNGDVFRGNPNLCRCLPGTTLIATPDGPSPISSLRVGDLVWSVDTEGNRVAEPLLFVNTVPVPKTHKMVHIELADRRELKVSPLHPNEEGCPLGNMNLGEVLDGSQIVSTHIVPYAESSTWDILPGGATAMYYADGILIGSTLADIFTYQGYPL